MGQISRRKAIKMTGTTGLGALMLPLAGTTQAIADSSATMLQQLITWVQDWESFPTKKAVKKCLILYSCCKSLLPLHLHITPVNEPKQLDKR